MKKSQTDPCSSGTRTNIGVPRSNDFAEHALGIIVCSGNIIKPEAEDDCDQRQ